MQTNSQHSGQLQNLHGKGTTPGNGTSQNFYQLCLPSHTASPSYSGQTATGNYLTCTIQPANNDQILGSGVQATTGTTLAQENQLNSNHTLQTGKQDSQITLWNMPSNCKIFLPVNNIIVQSAPNNNGPNMSHCAFNSTNSLHMQPQTTSAVGPNNLQRFKTIDTRSLNEARINVSTSNLHGRQHYANAPTNLPIDSSKTRKSLPSDLNYCAPTENAHHGPGSFFGGYLYQFAENSNNANVQMPSTCAQNLQPTNVAQRAIAVVSPLSPIGTAPVNVLDKSANVKMNVSPVQETVHHQPNIPHPLVTNANLMNQTGEPNDLTNKHQRPKSAEPRLNDGLWNVVGDKGPVLGIESNSQSLRASSPNLKCVVTEQNNSAPAQMQNEPAEKTNKNCTITDKKTIDPDTVPFIEWPLDRLQTLIAVFHQLENGHQKNIKTDPGKEILKLYWNGDTRKFSEAVDSGVYQSVMEEIYLCSPMNEPVILKQIVNDARSKVIKDFHVLKHNEAPPKMTYTSSWLNLNENVDDIDKECGYSWFYKSFQNVPEQEAQNLECEAPRKSQEATEKPSLIRTKLLPSEVENKAPAGEPILNNTSLRENIPVSFQSPPVTNINCSTKHNCQVTELTKTQPIITNSLEAMVDLDEPGVPTGKSSLDNQFGPKSVVPSKSTTQSDYTNSPKPIHVVAEQQEIVLSSQMQVGSSQKLLNNDSAILDKNVRCEKNMCDKICVESPVPSNAWSPTVIELQRDVVNEQQTNTGNPLKGMKNLVRTLEKRNVSLIKYKKLFEKHGGLKKHKPSSRTSKLDNSNGNGVRAQSPILIDDSSSDSIIEASTLNPVVEKQVQNESSEVMLNSKFDKTLRCETNPEPCQEPSIQINDERFVEMDASSSVKLDVLTQEVAKRCFAEKDIAPSPKNETLRLNDPLCNRAKSPVLADGSNSEIDYASPPKLIPVFTRVSQIQNESDEEMPEIDCVLSDESVRYDIDPKPSQELSLNMNEEELVNMDASVSIKINVLPHKVAKQCFAGRLLQDQVCQSKGVHLLNTMTHLARAVEQHSRENQHQNPFGNASPPTLHPVLSEPSPVQSDEEMPKIDSLVTDKNVTCDTDPKPGLEFPVEMNEEDIDGLDTSVCIKINVLPHEVAMQCFADQMMENEDIAAPPETMHKACLLNSTTDTVSTKEPINMWRLEGTDGAKSPALTEGSTSQSNCASPPNLDPVIKEPSQVQNKSIEEMPEIDFMLTDESVRCETPLKPSQELPVNMNEGDTEKIDSLDSFKINVIPHEMAELWFAGEMEDKDLQKDTTVHNSTEDQVKLQVLELKSEKEVLLEDVKPKEKKYPSSGGEELKSFCCLAKWFQTLEYGNGSLCMCQIKAELSEKEIKTEAHSTSLEVQAEKDHPVECKLVEVDAAALERTDDSEATDDSEDESPLLHNPAIYKIKIAKDISRSEEVSNAETETSEQERNESPSKCATSMTLMNEIEQNTPVPDLKKTNTVCLALYGSSSEKGNQLKLTKRYKEKPGCEEPPKTLQVTISSHLKVKNKSKSKKRKFVESEDEDATDGSQQTPRASLQNLVQRKSLPLHPVSALSKNRLSFTPVRNLLSQSANVKSDARLAEGNKRKRRHTTQQMSMNKYIIRGKTVPSKLLHSPENVKKSKYELGNPALMPLDEGPALEFKVLPETFNFEDGAELNFAQDDTLQSMQNEMPGPEEKEKKMKTGNVPTQGVWSFSPLKKKCTQPIQDTDVSGSCSLFQEFKKKFQEKKDISSKKNLNSSERD